MTCMECGHSWDTDDSPLMTAILDTTCPACGNNLKMRDDKKKKYNNSAYYAIITTAKSLQVIRFFWLQKYYRHGSPAEYFHQEVMQHWIAPDGNMTRMEIGVNGLSQYIDQWVWNSELEIRTSATPYSKSAQRMDIRPLHIWTKKRFIPELKRKGFKGNFHNITPHGFISLILSDNKAETLLKAGQISMMVHRTDVYLSEKIDMYWSTIKICMRNGYIVKDAKMYFDYLRMLEYYHKDLRNPKYVCPEDLKKAHDRLVDKRNQEERKRKLQEQKERMERDQIEYEMQKKAFFGLQFTDGKITVKVLESVQEFFIEGDTHSHCVFAARYYKKPESLVLSAQMDKERLETVEVSLRDFQIKQARGKKNGTTKYHNQIVEIVNKNIPKIENIVKQNKALV